MNKNEIQDKLKQMEQEMADLRKKLDEPELLPCPFCGRSVEIKPEGDYFEIACNWCKLSMWEDHSYERLVDRWNERV